MERTDKPRVYAFIDSQNLNVTTQKLGWKMDWQKFRRFLADKYGVTKAFMFIGYVPEFEDLYEKLHEAGYAVVLKPTYDMTRPYKQQPVSQLDATQGDGEERIEAYGQYGEQAPQPATKQHAKSIASVTGSAGEQGDALRKPVKGNIDADLVLWVMKEAKNYDKAVIISDDGDFYSLVEYLAEKGKLLKLLTPSSHHSRLFNRFDQFIDRVDQHRRQLAYRDYKKPKK